MSSYQADCGQTDTYENITFPLGSVNIQHDKKTGCKSRKIRYPSLNMVDHPSVVPRSLVNKSKAKAEK